jgi:hypothetical protein
MAIPKKLSFEGTIKCFPQKGGWHYVQVPKSHSIPLLDQADRGLIAITATVGNQDWATSFLPFGDGSHFLALPAVIRKKANIKIGDKVTVTYRTRKR